MRRVSALFVCLALAVSACGVAANDEPSDGAEQASRRFPVTVDTAGGSVVIERRPERIVSLSPTATEILYAIGAGDQVVAVDQQSDYPPGVPTTELSAHEPNVEAIAAYEPDLVVASDAAGLRSLSKLDMALLVQPAAADLDQAYDQFKELGAATGHANGAAQAVARMRSRIADIVARAPTFEEKPTYYHELDETYFTVTSDTFIGQVYASVGLENIADEADDAGTGYPQLSAEYIIEADPDFIFLADSECCGQTPQHVAGRPGWGEISAVRDDAVFDVGDDVSSRWGPRVVDFLEKVVDALQQVEPAT
jgi:iron complex transport system substrate-binding protein